MNAGVINPLRATCRGCSREIVWGQTCEGKRIPLDPRPAVYKLLDGAQSIHGVPVEREYDVMVTHFATCANAAQFSGRNK